MSFPHDARDFVDLLRVVAGERGLTEALVEKDYWVTHTLWSLSQSRLDVWFKGGTSLSKGFGLITRFSEDLDLKIDRGHLDALPLVKSWTSKNPGPTASRRAFYEALGTVLSVPGARVELDPESLGKEARTAEYKVLYPGQFLGQLAPPMRPFILLEVGHARVLPYVERPIDSWTHDALQTRNLLSEYSENRPRAVRCVHPLVTLLDKLDAISSRFSRGKEAPSFVRHYEDAARIIQAADGGRLAAITGDARGLGHDMFAERDIRALPSAADPAFTLAAGDRGDEIARAYQSIAPMFWGPRVPLDEALTLVRDWVARTFG